ncbi:MAG: ABC transporter ATP-binding protein [Pikeienuella sp.]|uniref:ABC transporter ATP-binding protein n=1 Tax=Pikeienuella sp. TaxID=2831957 RepID=UPI00391BE4A9
MLEVRDLHVQYGRLVALRGVSFSVAEGEIACIVGPNGAGKSTTLLTVSGVLKPTMGEVIYDGKPIAGRSPEAIAGLGVTQVPEGRHIFTGLTIEENLRVGAALRRDRDETRKDMERIYETFPILGQRKGQAAGKLSGGEQQMLAIGRALMSRPKLMTIDEPSLGLAPKIVDRVYEVLTELRASRGLTLLIVEQSSERALKAADRLHVLRSGEIQLSGQAADLRDGAEVHKAYFGFTKAHEGEVMI